jgi:hypothetical protein
LGNTIVVCPLELPARPVVHRFAVRAGHRWVAWGAGITFRRSFDVLEYSPVNPVDDRIGPESPVSGGPEVMLIPGRPFEPRAATGDFRESKFTSASDQEAVEVRLPYAHRAYNRSPAPEINWQSLVLLESYDCGPKPASEDGKEVSPAFPAERVHFSAGRVRSSPAPKTAYLATAFIAKPGVRYAR